MRYQGNAYREIITKAVCGKGEKRTTEVHRIHPKHRPSTVLGCWIINHRYEAYKTDEGQIEIRGNFDVNLWYAFDEHRQTEVVLQEVSYCDRITLEDLEENIAEDTYDCLAKVVQQPTCIQCTIHENGEEVEVEVEREFVVKLICETNVLVRVESAPTYQVSTESASQKEGTRSLKVHQKES